MEDPGKWRTWGVRGHETMHAGHEKLRTWGNGEPGELEKMQGLRNGIPGEMEYLGKWRTCGVRGHEKMHAGLEKWMKDLGKLRT